MAHPVHPKKRGVPLSFYFLLLPSYVVSGEEK
jgi:hypothetical protein